MPIKKTNSTISSNGEITIPKAVLEQLNLRAGTKVSIEVAGEALVMRFVRDYPDWHTMRGMFRGVDLI